MKVHVIGPNLLGQNEQFHVHAEGCTDVRRSPVYASRDFDGDKRYAPDMRDRRTVVEYVYADQIAESGGLAWEDYEHDFKWFGCVSDLPVDAEPDDAEPDDELPRTELTGDTLAAVAGSYSGRIHGDDRAGNWDVEFPNIGSAYAFAEVVREDAWGWMSILRDPVTDLRRPCVLTIWDGYATA